METIRLSADEVEIEVVNAAKDGSPLAYRLITRDPETREILLPLLAKKAEVAFEIGVTRFHGLIQTHDVENPSDVQKQSLAFIVNLLLDDTEAARISESLLQGVGTDDVQPNRPTESTIPWIAGSRSKRAVD